MGLVCNVGVYLNWGKGSMSYIQCNNDTRIISVVLETADICNILESLVSRNKKGVTIKLFTGSGVMFQFTKLISFKPSSAKYNCEAVEDNAQV